MDLPHQQAPGETMIVPLKARKSGTGQYAFALRPIRPQDAAFLCQVYESTRQDEMASTGWTAEEIRGFLRMQFWLQHTQYLQNYDSASFDMILVNNSRAGRLYVNRSRDDMRIIDIALLPEFRRQGVGSRILGDLIVEADQKGLLLSLHVEQNNPVLSWYERLGFKKAGVNGIYVFMKRKPEAIISKIAAREDPMIEKLSLSSFHPHLKDRFEVRTKSGEKVDLELVEIRDTSTAMVDGFHLVFRGPLDKVFGHDTHRVKHGKIGEFDLFLGPVMYGKTDGTYYQAVFSRLKAGAKTASAKKTAKKAVIKKTAKKAAKKTQKIKR